MSLSSSFKFSEAPSPSRGSRSHIPSVPTTYNLGSLDIVNEDVEAQAPATDWDKDTKVLAEGSGPVIESKKDNIDNRPPPSFAQSEFETIIRRQRVGGADGRKLVTAPSRFPRVDNEWEFAGWGQVSYKEIKQDRLDKAHKSMSELGVQMGQFRSSSISGNGVVGSVFYAFPAVAAVASVFSPLSLLIACLILTVYRPILLELGSAIRLNGANYIYLLQCSGKTLGAVGAAATLLDAVATSVVSAATAGAYIQGETSSGAIEGWSIGLILLVSISLLALVSLRESSALTLSITIIHMLVMIALMVGAAIAWGRTGMGVLRDNWELRPVGSAGIARSIFNGVCIGFLGVTGYECTPAYIQSIKRESYGPTLRNLLAMALFLNAPLMLLVYALLPSETILSGANVLSLLAEVTIGKPMRTVVVIDCFLVLAGGVFTGLVTGSRLVESLAQERVLPQFFLRTLPITGAAYMPVLLFFVLCLVVYASSAFSLATVSTMFSASFLFTMLLYGISCLLLKFSRDRLPRAYRTSLWTVVLAIMMMLVVLGGNIALNPRILGLFVAYFAVVLLGVLLPGSRLKIARIALWALDQTKFARHRRLDKSIVSWIKRFSEDPVVLWVKGDHINHLVRAIIYIRRNELTSRVKLVHAYKNISAIPSELRANTRILDEAFPSITLDLMFIQGEFSPNVSSNAECDRID
ncbi:hypothetical protein RSOLAG1IB_01158 [Rhizoctonia solani AG-1 IB]|uniref:Uncharacterized protein n=1 Tax=Thanatephorus cucumeris (strain AG1-IB / isolate 7/3/14) TaxID=1108050 RepID=A0A0B7FC73_THACB|nr:hypothetical protein RSOLAG1IB_01158 [Rhizoctonia solani AG-1 IB]